MYRVVLGINIKISNQAKKLIGYVVSNISTCGRFKISAIHTKVIKALNVLYIINNTPSFYSKL